MQYLDDIIKVKNGTKKLEYLTDDERLKNILDVTYGSTIYQEQVMQLFQDLAGYSLGKSDEVRRAMSKKKMDKLAHEKEAFIHGDAERDIVGCVANGIPEDVANTLFDQMTEFAKYAFNKSHAAAYALIAYWTGWLKQHYPAEFLMSAMNWSDTDDDIRGLMQEARFFGVEVLAPDVNRSASRFTVTDGKILFGLGSIRSVGETGNVILAARRNGGPFTSLKDFFIRTQIKKNAVENLIKAGALDAFCKNRQTMLALIQPYKDLAKKYADKSEWLEQAKKLTPFISECGNAERLDELQKGLGIAVLDKPTDEKKWTQKVKTAQAAADKLWEELSNIIVDVDVEEDKALRMKEEHAMLGAYITAHPLDIYPNAEELGCDQIGEITPDTTRIMGIITELQIKNRRSDGKPMAFMKLEDKSGSIEVNVFTKAYNACAKYLGEGNVVIVNGRVSEEDTRITDENGLPIKVLKFNTASMETAQEDRRATMMVSSYPVFHVTQEDEFRSRYEQKGGYKFSIYDQAEDIIRTMKYRVSKEVFELENVM